MTMTTTMMMMAVGTHGMIYSHRMGKTMHQKRTVTIDEAKAEMAMMMAVDPTLEIDDVIPAVWIEKGEGKAMIGADIPETMMTDDDDDVLVQDLDPPTTALVMIDHPHPDTTEINMTAEIGKWRIQGGVFFLSLVTLAPILFSFLYHFFYF